MTCRITPYVPEARDVPAAREELYAGLRPLLTAEAAAEAAAVRAEPADLEQGVWLRLLEHLAAEGPPAEPARWLRAAVRAEARGWRHRTRWEAQDAPEPGEFTERLAARTPEQLAVNAHQRARLHAVVRRLPGRCAALVTALLSPEDRTYREIAGELGISQGSLGPERSRCLGCLRRMLAAEVAAPEAWEKEWGTT
ncbi:sigma-70 family RNA polymerase sigma factor [Streptomyces albus]|nr:sigma-70 family RNA polymerase sigma factor [Streptomyces albus]